ncbi:MAG: metal-dependent transcriptional regulator [Deltaproteobacteria bacterium]|nr:metal-dependent transcriptional regulator [Deltaproteobacteria bacterium]
MNNHESGKALTSTMEDYLEAIYDIGNEKRVVRVKDIAEKLGVRMPTVTSMLKTLDSRGLIEYEKYGYIDLTSKGESVGQDIHRKHEILFRFLTGILKIDPVTADEEACKVEHALGEETLCTLVKFMEFIQACPRLGDDWLKNFEKFKEHGLDPEECEVKSKAFVENLCKKIDSTEHDGR